MVAEMNSGHPAALGGEGWIARQGSHRENRQTVWADFGVSAEYAQLRSVLMHRPGAEIEQVNDPRYALWDAQPDPVRAREEHDALVELYRRHGVAVHLIDTPVAQPNLYFVRDTFAMTPEGAVLARPASLARAGEERIAAQALVQLGIPLVLSVYGSGVFEGADLLLAGADLALIAEGMRTNRYGAQQVTRLLEEIGIGEVVQVDLPNCLHLDCALSLIDRDLALIDSRRIGPQAVGALQRHGFQVLEVPHAENEQGMAINMVTLAPRVVVLPTGNPSTCRLLTGAGVTCLEADIHELSKGAGAVHCMTGVLYRDGL